MGRWYHDRVEAVIRKGKESTAQEERENEHVIDSDWKSANGKVKF